MKLNFRLKIIDKYLFKRVFLPFLFGIFLTTIILLSRILYDLTDWLIVESVPLITILEYLLLKLPEIVVETLPIGILFGTIYGLGRLNENKEITALQMGGINLFRLILPITILGIVVSLFTYSLNEHIVPPANQRARQIYRTNIINNPDTGIQEDVFFEDQGRLYHASKYNEEKSQLENIVIFTDSYQDKYPRALTAPRGKVQGNIWQLDQVQIHNYNNGLLENTNTLEQKNIELSRDFTTLYEQQLSTGEMSLAEIRDRIEISELGGTSASSLLVDYHLELATSFAPLILIWLGAPLSLSTEKGKAVHIILTILIILLYYVLQSIFASMGRNNIIHPVFSAWFPHLLFLLLGMFLIFKQKFV